MPEARLVTGVKLLEVAIGSSAFQGELSGGFWFVTAPPPKRKKRAKFELNS